MEQHFNNTINNINYDYRFICLNNSISDPFNRQSKSKTSVRRSKKTTSNQQRRK
jgi:hypothetical protein